MRIPPDLTQISLGTCSFTNPVTQAVVSQPNLDVEILTA